jgi:hypothetical protein
MAGPGRFEFYEIILRHCFIMSEAS